MERNKNVWITLSVCVCALGLAFLDQAAKHLASVYLKQGSDIRLIPGVLHLHYLYPENRGIAFGMLQGGAAVFALLTVLMMLGILLILYRIPKNAHYIPLLIVCLLLLSGAAGNLIDRVFRGYVIDFIYFILIDFPVFNLADVYVVSGGILLIITGCFLYQDKDFAFMRKNGND